LINDSSNLINDSRNSTAGRGRCAMTPNPLLVRYSSLLLDETLEGPVLDLACGTGENGLFVASLDLPVVLADRSSESLDVARRSAEERGLTVQFWHVELETGPSPLEEELYRAILVFRYLHRPLIPSIRRALRGGGVLMYETFTVDQPKYGRPCNPDYLLQPGELDGWFKDWDTIHYFEGVLDGPTRAMAQIVSRKPVA
jgi:SAM-dependent methyltransferase